MGEAPMLRVDGDVPREAINKKAKSEKLSLVHSSLIYLAAFT
jgi:hypothetical protein